MQNSSKMLALAFTLAASLTLVAPNPAEAERPKVGFLTSVEEPIGPDLTLYTVDGRKLEGSIGRQMAMFGSVTKLTFKTHDGEKHKLRADEVESVTMPVDGLTRTIMVGASTTTLEKIWKTDFERIFEVDILEFHAVRHPKSERTALRQLVNPGFDSRLRVYFLPTSTEGIFSSGSTPIFGDMPKAFLVVKDDGEVERIKQKEYRKKVFPRLYADCPELLERYQGDLRKFKFFAEHVFLYDQMCPGPGSPTYPVDAEPVETSQAAS